MNIASTVSELLKKGIESLASKYKTDKSNIAIEVTCKMDRLFYVCITDKQHRYMISFIQAIGKTMDLLKQEKLATPYLKKALEKYAKSSGVEVDEMRALILQKTENISVEIYRADSYVTTVTIDQLLT